MEGGRVNPLEQKTVRELVIRAQKGDEQAFAKLIEAYQSVVFRLIFRITGNEADAEDVCQEAFLRAYRALGRFDPERPFGPWILKIAANRALTQAGGRRFEADVDALAETLGGGDAVETGLERAGEIERVQQAMGRLPAVDRALLALHYEDEMKLAQIAETMGLREGTVRVRLFRARERLMNIVSGGEKS